MLDAKPIPPLLADALPPDMLAPAAPAPPPPVAAKFGEPVDDVFPPALPCKLVPAPPVFVPFEAPPPEPPDAAASA